MNNYWEKRAIASAARTEKAVNSQEKYLEETFESARKRVGSALADFYLRYANENGVTFAEAQQCLSEAELKEFRGTLEDFTKMAEESFGTYNRELENLSMRVRVTRLQALEAEIKAVLDSLYGKVNTVTTDTLQAVYESSYYHALYDIDKYTGILHNVAKLNTRTIQNAVQYPYSGLKFSERIWGYQVNLNERLKAKIVEMCIQGKNPRDYAAVFAKEFDTQTFYAKRLLATEAAYNSNAATMKAYEEDNIEKYEICATLDSKTSIICREQDGKVYDLKDAKPGENHPPFHPFCRTTTVPVIDGVDLGDEKRVARDESGKVYKVPENMTYSEWKKRQSLPKIKDYRVPGLDVLEDDLSFEVEEGAIVTSTGKVLLRKLGDGHEVPFTEEDWALAVGKVITHTHTLSTPPSPADIYTAAVSGVLESRVVTKKGTYIMRNSVNLTLMPDYDEFLDEYTSLTLEKRAILIKEGKKFKTTAESQQAVQEYAFWTINEKYQLGFEFEVKK